MEKFFIYYFKCLKHLMLPSCFIIVFFWSISQVRLYSRCNKCAVDKLWITHSWCLVEVGCVHEIKWVSNSISCKWWTLVVIIVIKMENNYLSIRNTNSVFGVVEHFNLGNFNWFDKFREVWKLLEQPQYINCNSLQN